MKYESLIFIGWSAYGDLLSYNGMIRFLLNYYEKIYLPCDSHLHYYASVLYSEINERLILVDSGNVNRIVSENPNIFILNSRVNFTIESGIAITHGSFTDFSNLVEPNKFIWSGNKINNVINLDEKYTRNDIEYVDNSSNFYINVGLNPKIKTNHFFYHRKLEHEVSLYNELLNKNNINPGEEYIVICEFGNHIIKDEYKNNKKIINIDWCTSMPLHLGKVLENASEIHLIENSHSLFLYYMCVSNLLTVNKVNIHIYARNRSEYYHKMMMNPKIESWNFIFE